MSADFWASSVSGIAGLLVGNPLDIAKVRLQAGSASSPSPATATIPLPRTYQFSGPGSLLRGSAAPILGSGALNAILFMTKNRTSDFLTPLGSEPSLWTTWLAGAVGGLAAWCVSTPIELVKCRTQLSSPAAPTSSWMVAKEIVRREGLRGLYFGGVVTALRDSIGYGFYFWSYELTSRFLVAEMKDRGFDSAGQETAKVLVSGGIAGVVTWASVFPLDVVKTRVQAQVLSESTPLLATGTVVRLEQRKLGAVEIARNAYRNEGAGVFFRGLGVCSLRAFVVNAVQWAVYEWIMRELGPRKPTLDTTGAL